MLSRHLVPDRSLWLLFGGSWDDLGVDFPLPFQDPEDNRFTACSTTLLPRTRRAPKVGFINLADFREGR